MTKFWRDSNFWIGTRFAMIVIFGLLMMVCLAISFVSCESPEFASAVADVVTATATVVGVLLAVYGIRTWASQKLQERLIESVHAYHKALFVLATQLALVHDLITDLLNITGNLSNDAASLNREVLAYFNIRADHLAGQTESALTELLVSWVEVRKLAGEGDVKQIDFIETEVTLILRKLRAAREGLGSLTTEWNRHVIAAVQHAATELNRKPDPTGTIIAALRTMRRDGEAMIIQAYSARPSKYPTI
jgi:hypothetical protein